MSLAFWNFSSPARSRIALLPWGWDRDVNELPENISVDVCSDELMDVVWRNY